ncbi:hypothetical protein OPT61_g9055 [Boeremia exigua]|uniref:Uncharacterized protein n=1 Tax=Boeremia exigua TaxID=749465 RepID=A0ACC2HXD2_9PLEO|nr:hypothetical protein OPT61_g9055 [Boeremia exigua]
MCSKHFRIHDPQTQSDFLNRLPGEVRNEVYALVFEVTDWSTSEAFPLRPQTRPPHPLSLLLTCRRVHHEASILAFRTYTFPIWPGTQPTYLGLKSATSHLSQIQVEAVRSLSALSNYDAGSLISNALLLFPRLERFVIKSEKSGLQGCAHRRPAYPWTSHSSADWSEDTRLSLQAVEKYAPPWLLCVVESVTDGTAYRWQIGCKWTVKWPQLDSELCYSRIECDMDGLREELFMDADAVGTVSGVQKCVFGCRDVSWTSVVLVQEGGRRIDIGVVYCDGERSAQPKKQYVPKIALVPGTTPAGEVVVAGTGIKYEVDDEYWETMRRRNGDWGALCRGFWKSAAVWPVAATTSKRGSSPAVQTMRDDISSEEK